MSAALSAVAALIILAMLATGAAYWAMRQRDIAVQQRSEANRQRDKTIAREMATESMLRLGKTGAGLIEAALQVTESLRLSYSLNGYMAATYILNILSKLISKIEQNAKVNAVKFIPQSGESAVTTGESTEAFIEVAIWETTSAPKRSPQQKSSSPKQRSLFLILKAND
jgi:hypothetical protein